LALTYLFISHNLAVVDYIADRIAVMLRWPYCRNRRSRNAVFAIRFILHPGYSPRADAGPSQRLDFDQFRRQSLDPGAWPNLSDEIPQIRRNNRNRSRSLCEARLPPVSVTARRPIVRGRESSGSDDRGKSEVNSDRPRPDHCP